jgi:hypothetical protein
MKPLFTHDSPQGREKSSYFVAVQQDCIRMYGKEKGVRLASRFWDIRSNLDTPSAEERYKIVHGLA